MRISSDKIKRKISAMKCFLVLVALVLMSESQAHDIRPAYFELELNNSSNVVNVIWKTSLFGNPLVNLHPEISGFELDLTKAQKSMSKDAKIWRWKFENAEFSVLGQVLTIKNLEVTSTDVMVKQIINGKETVTLLKPEANTLVIGDELKRGKAIARYTRLGIEHIMLGIDHLLFVLGLLLLSKTRWLLIKTITSFTIGHSISLGLATIGFLMVPEKPLSAVIALSIVFLGWELIRAQKGEESITIRNPWLVSFFFGIIHGIGFAGGLVNLGLPKADIPLALLFFNVGVEIGQLFFIVLTLALMSAIRKLEFSIPQKAELLPAYAIGSFATYWFIGRLIMIF